MFFGASSIIIGGRYHANIVGLALGKTVIPVIYSSKTKNALDDINFQGKVIDIEKIDEFNVNDIKDSDLNYKIDVSKEIKDSSKHFKKLDEIFNNN